MTRRHREKSIKEWDVRLPTDELAQPTFHAGGKIGCIVQHGIGGTPANVRLIADKLKDASYTVDVPLLPGHGTTVRELRAATAEDWFSAVLASYDRLKAAGCTEIIPVGLSLGGVLMSLVAANRPCKALVVMAPPIRMRYWLHATRLLHRIVPFTGYTRGMRLRTERDLPYSQMYNCFTPRALHHLQRLIRRLRSQLPDITCPVFAVWAGKDDKVHPTSRGIFRRGLKNAETLTEHYLPEAIHGCTYYIHSRDEVAALVFDYITAIAPLP